MSTTEANEIHVNGRTTFQDTITDDGTAIDISSATKFQIHFLKPKWRNKATGEEFPAEVVKVTSSLVGGGTGGIHEYDAAEGFLDRPGKWRRQSWVTISGKDWPSNVIEFEVHPNLEDEPGVLISTG